MLRTVLTLVAMTIAPMSVSAGPDVAEIVADTGEEISKPFGYSLSGSCKVAVIYCDAQQSSRLGDLSVEWKEIGITEVKKTSLAHCMGPQYGGFGWKKQNVPHLKFKAGNRYGMQQTTLYCSDARGRPVSHTVRIFVRPKKADEK